MNPAEIFAQETGLAPQVSKPRVYSLGSLQKPPKNDPKELLKHRFLCRGGGMLLAGPTGIGKSTLVVQLLICWALGRPAFGIQPARKLKSFIIQAENDEGDMAEMREGIMEGMALTDKERATVGKMIYVCPESERTSLAFFQEVVIPILKEHQFDLLVIDPVLAYLGGETNSQKDVGAFLRNQLNPLLQQNEICGLVVHHTNKPPSGKEKKDWTIDEMAYVGAGSAEWANWPRAVISIRSTGLKDSMDTPIYELCLGKRGVRAGWRNPETEAASRSKFIRHARNLGDICWHEVPPDEMPAKEERGKGTIEDIFEAVQPGERIEKKSLIGMKVMGIGKVSSRQLIDQLVAQGRFRLVKIKRTGGPAQVFVERPLEEPSP